jgi:hypothetical protein
MTTNIYDGNAKIMACDSRWSIPYGNWVFYLDDSGYEKILRHTSYSLMFAERVTKFRLSRTGFDQAKDASGMPPVKGMAVCMVQDTSGDIAFAKHHDIDTQNVLCAGSGALAAFGC